MQAQQQQPSTAPAATTTTTTTSPSYNIPLPSLHLKIPDAIDFSKSISALVLAPSLSFSGKAEELFSQYFTAVMIGAGIGAAVSAGLVGGLMASSGLIRYMYVRSPIISLWNYWSGKGGDSGNGTASSSSQLKTLRLGMSSPSSGVTNSIQNAKYSNSPKDNIGNHALTATTISTMNVDARGELFVMKSQVRNDNNNTSYTNSEQQTQSLKSSHSIDQCRECIRSLERLMEQCQIGWDCVRKMTVYLVGGRCKASEFYTAMEEVPTFPKERIVTTLLFVHMLENDSVVQVELLAAARS